MPLGTVNVLEAMRCPMLYACPHHGTNNSVNDRTSFI